MGFRRIIGVAGLVALVAACDVGVTHPSIYVDDTSALLQGSLTTEDAGSTVTWWFEYGTTLAFGSTTPEQSLTFRPGATSAQVAAVVTGLDEGTTYFHRTCVRNERGGGVCGAPQSFTTTSGRDSVQGTGIAGAIPELGYYLGVDVDASSAADGSDLEGTASRSPGVHYFRLPDEGVVTCLRVDGNRASVGFLADYTMYDPSLPLVPVVLYVEDNGATGDRFSSALPAAPQTTCPDPDPVLDGTAGNTVVLGDLVVHDHP